MKFWVIDPAGLEIISLTIVQNWGSSMQRCAAVLTIIAMLQLKLLQSVPQLSFSWRLYYALHHVSALLAVYGGMSGGMRLLGYAFVSILGFLHSDS
jgi:hypothetical protein